MDALPNYPKEEVINAAVAHHVAGTNVSVSYNGQGSYATNFPVYVRNPREVLLLLGQFVWQGLHCPDMGELRAGLIDPGMSGKYEVRIFHEGKECPGRASTFCLAGCIALLLARGIMIEGELAEAVKREEENYAHIAG